MLNFYCVFILIVRLIATAQSNKIRKVPNLNMFSLTFIISIVLVLGKDGEQSDENQQEDTLKIMPMSMQGNSDNQWPSGLVITYSEEDQKRHDNCITIGKYLNMSSEIALFKAIMDKLDVLQELEREDLPNFTILVPTNEAVIDFIKRRFERKNQPLDVNFTDADSVVESMRQDQWDTAVALLILPETWHPFARIMYSTSHLKTLEHRDAFYWRFRQLDDGSVKLRFEFKHKDEKTDELFRPVLVGIVYRDIPTCNGWMQVVDSMPF
eukprot:TRINITY_DN6908_c0_g1_i6.p1 TRINITY_DN6908_c0_g1~~TRINITY_DN6908_c0_g1_i6.p1  ORF type:complete len:267 (-),score=19.25 TRINITY_DN6908_c0_g1_i6:435-1235(-)